MQDGYAWATVCPGKPQGNEPRYSLRRLTIGATRAARRAGT